MQFLKWLKSESKAEALIGEGLIALEMGDPKKAGSDLMQGLIDLAPAGGKAAAFLTSMRDKLAADGFITPVATAPVAEATATPAAAEPVTVTTTPPA